MNSGLMMLLPLLMNNKKGGFSPEMLMNILGAGNEKNGVNPMLSLFMTMMGGKQENRQNNPEQTNIKSDPKDFLDRDVLNALNILLQLNGKNRVIKHDSQTN